ncbi:MAG TPA: hypothetical protein EYH53_01600 [Methanothermococcus okinawensis]|nr:hypothetical protein [Methanothermococcus okinawensis]
MKKTVPLLLFLLFILPQTSAEIICKIEGIWVLSFEITNTNPYTVFIAVPDEIYFSDRSLKYSEDFLKLGINGIVTTNKNIENYYTTLNGEVGIWIPPYTTVKIYKDGNFSYILSTSKTQDKFKVVGPALMDTTKVFDETQLKSLYKYGIVVNNYRLYVDGRITKSPNTEVISIIIPAPLVLKDYSSFYKFIGRYNVDIWVGSYRKYVNKHKTMFSKRYSELYNSIDDTLVPIMDNDLIDMDANLKLFDVPAMVFTTDDGEIKSLEFSYVMYKY